MRSASTAMEQVGSLLQLTKSDKFTEELKVASIHDPPFVYIEESPEGNFNYSGYLVDLWGIISEELNLKYKLLPPAAGGFGALLANGTWTGMVGEVVQKRADLALSWLHYRKDRSTVLEFVDRVPVFSASYDFYVRAGERDDVQLSAPMFASLLRPLHTNVWLALVACLLVLAVVLTVTVRLNRGHGETETTCREFSLDSSGLAVLMTVTGQGWWLVPDSHSARIVTIASWTMGILISINYTANLISYLTISRPETPISSLEEFVNSDDWTFAMEHGVGHLGDWATSSSAAERHLYHRVVDGDRFLALNGSLESVRRAAGPKTLLFYNIGLTFTWIKEEACHLLPLLEANPHRTETPNYLVLRKGLGPLRRRINLLSRVAQYPGNCRVSASADTPSVLTHCLT